MRLQASTSDSTSSVSSGYVSDSAHAYSDDESSSLATSAPEDTDGLTETLSLMDLGAHEKYAEDHKRLHKESLENASKMPERIEAIRRSFRTVREYWTRKNLQVDFDAETIVRCCVRWEELDNNFERIVTETNVLVSKGARRIKDFATDFCDFIGNMDSRDGTEATIEEKQEHLAQFRNELFSEQTSLFGPDSKKLYDLKDKITSLCGDVRSFGFEFVTLNFPGKEVVIEEIENLEGKLRGMKHNVFNKRDPSSHGRSTGIWSGVSAVLSLFSGDKGALDDFVEASLERHNENCEKKVNVKQLKKDIAEKKCAMAMRDEAWGKHTRNCEEQINQITDQLLAIASIWMALCSDTAELDVELDLVGKNKIHKDLFIKRLATTQQLYSCLYEILCKLTHAKSPCDLSNPSMAHNGNYPEIMGIHNWDKSCETFKAYNDYESGVPKKTRKRDKLCGTLSKVLHFDLRAIGNNPKAIGVHKGDNEPFKSHNESYDSETTSIHKGDKARDAMSKSFHPKLRVVHNRS